MLVFAIAAVSANPPAAQSVLSPIDWQIHDTDISRSRTRKASTWISIGSAERDRVTASGRLLSAREHILLTMDVPDDRRGGDFAHELTHTFQFDILPRPVVNDLPLWFTEGLAEHERGVWEPHDLTVLSELVRTTSVPRMSALAPVSVPEDPVLSRSLGHAAFDFVVSRWARGV